MKRPKEEQDLYKPDEETCNELIQQYKRMKLENEEDKHPEITKAPVLTKNAKMISTREQKKTLKQWEDGLRDHLVEKAEKQDEYERKMKIEIGVNEFTTGENSQISRDYMHVTPTMMLPMYCEFDTREKCDEHRKNLLYHESNSKVSNLTFKMCYSSMNQCNKIHFRPTVTSSTIPTLGDCSYLDTCKGKGQCKYIHYDTQSPCTLNESLALEPKKYSGAEWINCDVLNLNFRELGKFDVVLIDPPWDINMNLPYQTIGDKLLASLEIEPLQEEGIIFLWVTGRVMEQGRELLKKWGYRKVEEIVWVKINQLNKLIRTGRTGHWLNHSKEHCLVGLKGKPKYPLKLDTDVIVAKVRETSQKPDELYHMIERLVPTGRRIEIFARMNNIRPGWLSIGNQLRTTRLEDAGLVEKFKNGELLKDMPEE
ncbi:unnamed protein product [Moneuplotes crassus]|uniref:mRNA m(6)A methyltransferase n=1 Tax=Euplotes crassus TaxID=5936 RepID=A0AAD1UIM9_EUPCR|nr:unnamed protein product [Moneuplotes crassus]